MWSDQDLRHLLFVKNNSINQTVNSSDPDQMAWMCRLIWIYTVHPCHKGVYMEERDKAKDKQQIM
jgi:hypothetical protein